VNHENPSSIPAYSLDLGLCTSSVLLGDEMTLIEHIAMIVVYICFGSLAFIGCLCAWNYLSDLWEDSKAIGPLKGKK
jgi:hypothetical protein